MHRLRSYRASLFSALLFLLLGCSGGLLRAGTPFSVQLDWLPNAQYAGLLVAKDQGWYAHAGLDVTVVPLDQTTNDPVGPVVKGASVVGCADGLALLKARAAGQPIKVFATMLQASPLGIVTLRSSGIDRLESLRGKTVGLHPYDRAQLAILLKPHGLSLDDVKVKEIGDDIESLPAGKIDAQVVYLIDEKVAMGNKGLSLNVFPGYESGYLTYSQAYFTRENFLADHTAQLAKFIEVSNRGWQYAFEHPDDTAHMLIAKYLPGSDVNYQRRSIDELKKFAMQESPQLGQMRPATWQRSVELFHLDPALATTLPDFSVLKFLYGPR